GDGTFRVASAQPVAGTNVLSTRTRLADFNSDGKTDVLDPVDGTGAAHVWISSGNGSFTVQSYTPWAGYAISSARVRIADVNGAGRADVIDPIDGASYVNLWLSTGAGTFRAVSFTPSAPYALTSSRIRVADINGDGLADLLDPIDATATTNVWLSANPPP